MWVYAVGAGIGGPWVDDLRGVDGEAVRPISAAGLTALVGAVDRDAFSEEGLRHRLNDLDHLAELARAHHEVIRIAADHQPVAPARLATLYTDDGRVRAMLEEKAEVFTAALGRIRGRHEWGVKAFAATERPKEPTAHPATGTAYLRQRRASLTERQDTLDMAEQVHAALTADAVAAYRRPPQDPTLSGDRRRMLLNAAYLVEDPRRDEFLARVSLLAQEHPRLAVELTGPWPPYSFAAVDEEALA
jgi:hypothetical protein